MPGETEEDKENQPGYQIYGSNVEPQLQEHDKIMSVNQSPTPNLLRHPLYAALKKYYH
jgi:hypothetical protein